MYMILHPTSGMMSCERNGVFQALFTDDLHRVSQALDEKNVRVFKLDSLVEVKDIEITYQEITNETEK